ncbi:MAG: hypothetical protein AABY07_08820 [Nanoarchaeota archaeon]
MGGGKRNYRSMRAKHRQWQKDKAPKIEEKKKEVSKEDIENLLAILEKNKKKDGNKA